MLKVVLANLRFKNSLYATQKKINGFAVGEMMDIQCGYFP